VLTMGVPAIVDNPISAVPFVAASPHHDAASNSTSMPVTPAQSAPKLEASAVPAMTFKPTTVHPKNPEPAVARPAQDPPP
jgi:hypothetical protein